MMRLFAIAATATLAMAMDTSDQPGADLTVLATATPVHRVNRTGAGFGHVHPAERKGENPIVIAQDALRHEGLDPHAWGIESNYKDAKTGMVHLALRQRVAGLECANCIATVNVDAKGRVVSLGYTAHVGAEPKTEPTLTAKAALEHALAFWNATLPSEAAVTESSDAHAVFGATSGLSPHDVKVTLEVLATGRADAALIWEVSIETEDPYYHSKIAQSAVAWCIGLFVTDCL